MKEKSIKKILTIIVVGIIILSIAFISLKYQVEDIADDEEGETSFFIKILADASSGTAPLSVNFKSLILDEKGTPEYFWEFGDGNTSTEKDPTYVYKKEGTYSCTLKVKDKNVEKTDSFNITILKNNPPDVKIILSKNTAFRPETINFDAQVFDPEGDKLEYEWTLRYPAFFGWENTETYTEKNFSKKFWRNGNYVAELTVTDEAGNSVYQFARLQMQKSQPEMFYQQARASVFFLPTTVAVIWIALGYMSIDSKITDWLDEHWLEWSEGIQKLAKSLLIDFLGLDYEPPIHKADLEILDISDINHSSNVDSSGGVSAEVSESSSIIVENKDDITAKNMYITLYNPLTEEKGLDETIELEELEISIDIGSLSKKLFYNGKYTSYEDCYFIENLATGDKFTGDIIVTLNEADLGTFEKGTYDCNLYLYQEKADYVDIVPFKIVL
jgi:PKD repeat protein